MDKPIPQYPQYQVGGASGAMASGGSQAARVVARAARKVPEVTIFFWIVKLLTTAMGESTSDFLVFHMPSVFGLSGQVVGVLIGFIGFVIALALQFLVRRYIAAVYWFAALMVAVFGTMAADVVHVVLGVEYVVSVIGFALALAVIFAVWYVCEHTLSIHSINTFRRECFYWAAIIATFALGTATGDWTASTLQLGYFASGILFIILFALPGLGYRFLGLNSIFTFWFAYIMTRPLGASFADWFGKEKSIGGLGIGDSPVSLVLGILIVAFVAYLTVSRVDIPAENTDAPTQRRHG